MNSSGDLSQISDISRISRLNCSRIFGRIDSLQNLFEQQCSLSYNTSRNTTNQESNHLEKTIKCLASCEDSIGEHVKSKVILECIKEASMNVNGILSDDVAFKLKGLLSIHELNKYMHLPSTSKNIQEELCILGITDLPKFDLSYEEILDIKYCVETLLREKIHEFILRYEQLGGNLKETLRSIDGNMRKKMFEPHEIQIFQWKDKIEELCAQYEADIMKCKALMNKWNTLKYKDVSKLYLEKAEHILLQAQVAEVQAKITKLSCIIKMYKETPITIDAFRTLNVAIDKKLFAILSEIKEKENLKKQYEKLQNTEYNEILKTYLHFCKAIEKKKQLLEKL
ncbi:uncharacterized protein LOC117230258 [Bombus vosnesenskii]|uniref:Uncharacterized protein LOC117230258 n=2 Tax=Pyrobombus TaxID=144703 RepID=A0A6J3JTF0_9HYME|nr:uncharacterized protein LOC117163791 [Bombus vancouverensis nearcticus]XP_033299415.1 uncharacterized protein LOC117205284 [Bombus bifarius]XP_033343385.1 uncharacterized protein LOC117230258 [Bombus vosnesenskii]XP_050475761.1 uncharacterized protein LOC126866340 [Bombus huntii]